MKLTRLLPAAILGLVSMLTSLAGCDGDEAGDTDEASDMDSSDSTDTGSALSHAADIQPIWEASCVTDCHSATGSASTVVRLDGDAYAAIVDINSSQAPLLKLVEPGNSAESYLVLKLEGNQVAAGGTGQAMPSGGNSLDGATIQTIKDWIDAGAPP